MASTRLSAVLEGLKDSLGARFVQKLRASKHKMKMGGMVRGSKTMIPSAQVEVGGVEENFEEGPGYC